MIQLIDILIEMGQAFFKLLGELFVMIRDSSKHKLNDTYDASLAQPSSILKKNAVGFSCGGVYGIQGKANFQHCLVSAQSGAGKSVAFSVPSLFNVAGHGSVVVLDPSKELYSVVAPRYKQLGYKIIILNFSDRTGQESAGWNPFPEKIEDLPEFITALVQMELGSDAKDPFWQNSAIGLLQLLGKTMYQLEPKYRNVPTLYDLVLLLTAKPEEFDRYMSMYADEQTFNEYLSFTGNSDALKASIISTAKAVLQHVFAQDSIRRITAHSTFDIDAIRKEKTIIFLQTNASELAQYRLLISVFFHQLFNRVLAGTPNTNLLPLYCILDEKGIYRINSISLAITQGRKFGLALALIVQEKTTQLQHLYGDNVARTIMSSCYTQMFYTNQPLSTCRELSTISGKREVVDEKTGAKSIRPLLTPDEVRSLSKDKALVLHGHHRLTVVPIKPYYENSRFKKFLALPPHIPTRTLPLELLPPFPLHTIINPHHTTNE